MNDEWRWVIAVVVGFCILALAVSTRADRKAYWAAHDAVTRQVQAAPPAAPTEWPGLRRH